MRRRIAVFASLALSATVLFTGTSPAQPAALPGVGDAVLLATHGISVGSRVTVVSGDVVVDEDSSKRYEIEFNTFVTTPDGYGVRANGLKVGKNVVLGGDVECNLLGSDSDSVACVPLDLPVFDSLPAFLSGPIDGSNFGNVTIPLGTTDVLAPGNYGKLTVQDRAVAVLEGGDYYFDQIVVRKEASLLFADFTQVRINTIMEMAKLTTLGPDPASGALASDAAFFVAGGGEAVILAKQASISATIYAPNAKAYIGRETNFRGALIASTIRIGQDSTITLDSFFAEHAMVATDDAFGTDEDTVLVVPAPGLLANDFDPDLGDTIAAIAQPTPPDLFASAAGAEVTVSADGGFTYTPAELFNTLPEGATATDSFTYTAVSSDGTEATATVTITIDGLNDAPTTTNVGAETAGAEIIIVVTAADPDDGDDPQVIALGPVTGDGTHGSIVNDYLGDLSSAAIYFTPGAPDSQGNDPFAEFTFTFADTHGLEAVGTITVNSNEGDQNPPGVAGIVSKDKTIEVLAGVPIQITLVAAATLPPDPGAIGDLTITVDAAGLNGTLSTPTDVIPDMVGDPVRSALVSYDPGTLMGTSSFSFEACEVAQPTNCDAATVTVTVDAASPPVPPLTRALGVSTPVNTDIEINIASGESSQTAAPDDRGLLLSREIPSGLSEAEVDRDLVEQPSNPIVRTLLMAGSSGFGDEATFLAALDTHNTFDFEVASGFPDSASTIIGCVPSTTGPPPCAAGGVEFDAKVADRPTAPSPVQGMRGTGTSPSDGSATVHLDSLGVSPNAFGFYVDAGANDPSDVLEIGVFYTNEDFETLTVSGLPAAGVGAPIYFGFIADNTGIYSLTLQGKDTAGNDTEFFIDDLTVGTATVDGPDLIIDSLTHTPQNPTTSSDIEFTAVVKNIGDVTAAESTLSFKIGGESPSDPNALFAVPQLAPGESFQVGRILGLSVAQNYQNTAVADFDNDVAESDESNNTAIDLYTVTFGTDTHLQYKINTLPTGGTLLVDGIAIVSVPALVSGGLVTFSPATGFSGTAKFDFTVTSDITGLINTSTAFINVGSVLGLGGGVGLDFIGSGTGTVTTTGSQVCTGNDVVVDADGAPIGEAPCALDFAPGTTVTFNVRADPGSDFTGWGGDCAGNSTRLTVTVGSALACTVSFLTSS